MPYYSSSRFLLVEEPLPQGEGLLCREPSPYTVSLCLVASLLVMPDVIVQKMNSWHHKIEVQGEGSRQSNSRGIRNWKLKGKLNHSRKIKSPRYRLYRSQILQENMRWKALAEIYTMHSFAPFSKFNFLCKNHWICCQNFAKFKILLRLSKFR